MTSSIAIEKIIWLKPGEGIAASGQIPRDSEFFQDHFPDFPILPGVLALEMLKQTAEHYLRSVHGEDAGHYFLKEIHSTKFSLYLKPGDQWESQLTLVGEEAGQSRWNAKLLHQGKTAVSAQLVLALRQAPKDLMATQGG